MNSLCKQYISEVKLLLPAIGKSEKNYLASLTSNLEDFCDDTLSLIHISEPTRH